MLSVRFKRIPWLKLALILLTTLTLVACGKKVVLEAKIAVATSSSSAAAVDPNTIAPVISNPGDKLFPSNNLVQSTLATIDFDNANISADTGMAYTCFFDREVDGIVAATDACTSLTGGAAFNTATGVITWTPSTSAFGPYEIKVTGTNAYGSASRILIADVRPLFSTTNLIRYYDSQYAGTTGSQGINSPFTSSWTDLVGTLGAVTGTLTNFGATTSTGWAGSVTVAAPIANPYRLVFDGVDDHVDLGTAMNSESTLQFDTWIKPAAVATASATLLSNADTSNKGFNLYQSGLGNGKMVLSIGGIGYYQKVRAANPISYFRLTEANSVTALADESEPRRVRTTFSAHTTSARQPRSLRTPLEFDSPELQTRVRLPYGMRH